MNPARIVFFEHVEVALEYMKGLLFRPFNAHVWFTLGVSAWLSMIGQSGFGSNLPTNFLSGNEDFSDLAGVGDYVLENLSLIVTIAGIAGVFILALSAVLAWLSARGKFMFLDNLVYRRSLVSEPWRDFQAEGDSFFIWSFVFGLVSLTITFALIGGGFIAGWSLFRGYAPGDFLFLDDLLPLLPIDVAQAVFAATILLFVIWLAVAGFVNMSLDDFIVPIMYKRRIRAGEAWRVYLPLVQTHSGALLLYWFGKGLLGIAASFVILLAVVGTCCIYGCLLAFPYLNGVAMLPILVAFRWFSLLYLRQFGAEFDALSGPNSAPAPPAPVFERPGESGAGDPDNPYNPYR